MSKRQFKTQASSSRAASGGFGGGFGTSAFGSTSSLLSYVAEPPDLSLISDPHVVVDFKNLSKKDSTTKSKALEDLQKHVSSASHVEDAVLEAWIKIYPRTSIDTSRRVRQLAHSLQGQISAACGKRIARHLPTIVGAWLSGLYDNDRGVTKAAQDSLGTVFASPEKLYSLRKAYQQQIIEYCQNVIEHETVLTLSDERTTSPDDAEAKYARVVASAIGAIGNLLSELESTDIAKQQALYEEVLGSEKLWNLISYNDASLQRAVLRFLKICLVKQSDVLRNQLSHLSKSIIANGLDADHAGSSYEYIEGLISLSQFDPTIWTDHYSSKKSVSKRLRSFLKRGSQGGPREYWSAVCRLIRELPNSLLPGNGPDATEFLAAVHSGIMKKDEPRANLGAAFDAYVTLVDLITSPLKAEEQEAVLTEMLWPLFPQYLNPTPDQSQWTIPGAQAALIIGKAAKVSGASEILQKEWPKITSALIEAMKTSAPEQSKDYERSQNAVAEQGHKWATLQREILRAGPSDSIQRLIILSSSNTITEALELLRKRNGKPFCAAAIIESLLSQIGDALFSEGEISVQLGAFFSGDNLDLLLSPSMARLVSVLYLSHEQPWFESAWTASVEHIINSIESQTKDAAIVELLNSPQMPAKFELAVGNANIQSFILRRLLSALEQDASLSLASRTLKNASRLISSKTSEELLSDLTQSLTLADKSTWSLHGLELIAKQSPAMLKEYLVNAEGPKLIHNLLLLTESADPQISQEASALNSTIQALLSQQSDDPATKQTLLGIIQSGLSEATTTSVTVETLVEIGQRLMDSDDKDVALGVLPSLSAWASALEPFLQLVPRPSLAITNPLGGALYMVEKDPATEPTSKIPRDINGFSAAYRTASYLTKVLRSTEIFGLLSKDELQRIFMLLSLTVSLASDNLSYAGSNNLWNAYTPETESDAIEFVSDAQSLLAEWLQNSSDWWADGSETSFTFVDGALQACLEESRGLSASSFYHARIFGINMAELVEMHGWHSSKTSAMEATLRDLRKSKDVMYAAAFLAAYRIPLATSKASSMLCNNIVAELTGYDVHKSTADALRSLVLLNLMISTQDNLVDSIAKQRVVFLVQHLIKWLGDEDVTPTVKAEACRLLAALVPSMKDMYGEHWTTILSFITNTWANTPALDIKTTEEGAVLPLIHATLKLHAALQSLTKEDEANDDLLDAWKDAEDSSAKGLINLLKNSQHFPDEFHQPLRIVNELLARLISKIPLKQIDEPSELFPLLYVASGPVQKTAFEILHKQIPAAQEQVSLDTALENKTAYLPEELLSLILEAPTVAALADADFTRTMPLPLRGYLFSWLLVFDHFENASYKVKTDYIEHIKDGEYVPGLLDFLFDFLGHGRGKPIDASKFEITSYTPDTEESPEKDAQWLLTYLYFLCLKHIPSLAKSWWIDCKSRQKVLAVESWTEKFISPHVVSTALRSVSEWSTTQDAASPDEVLNIKVNQRAGEVDASYVIDEQTMAIRIRLPSTYPLHQAVVEGVNRVAVDERKWQSWLRNTQAVIAFSNGNITDGLVAFRRNLVGALKGQTECAICYSIISADKQLPSKKCSTCKNLFHTSCLYKWFKTSNASSCPLCRNLFHYG